MSFQTPNDKSEFQGTTVCMRAHTHTHTPSWAALRLNSHVEAFVCTWLFLSEAVFQMRWAETSCSQTVISVHKLQQPRR